MAHERITPKLLASFIEYAIDGKVTHMEWERFVLQHYDDPSLEKARSECARVMGGYAEHKSVTENREYLLKLSKELRGE